jgi:hypothetical protein
MVERANGGSTPIKTRTVLQHLFVIPSTYYERMELEEIYL